MLRTLVETPTPNKPTLPRLSFRWWEPLQQRQCACGRSLCVSNYEPPRSELRAEGCWDTSCLCGRVVTLYDLPFKDRQPPRGPAPTQRQREAGVSEEDLLDRL